jgi:ankyrin repeat protein
LLTTELRHALAFTGEDAPSSIQSWEYSDKYLEDGLQFEYLLVNRSRGLVEVLPTSRKSTRESPIRLGLSVEEFLFDEEWRDRPVLQRLSRDPPLSEAKRVQLIHESVRDFLIKGASSGLRILDDTLGTQYSGVSHNTLLATCINYIAAPEVSESLVKVGTRMKYRPELNRGSFESTQLPFLDYATSHLIGHARLADEQGIAQNCLPPRSFEMNIKTFRTWCYLMAIAVTGLMPITDTWPVSSNYFRTLADAPSALSLLNVVCQFNILSCVKALVEAGVDVNTPLQDLGGSLVAACRGGHCRVVSYLLDHGADVHSRDSDWNTGLHLAASNGNLPLCQLLLDGSADVERMDIYGRTPLYLACGGKHAEVVQLLLACGTAVRPVPYESRAHSTKATYYSIREKEYPSFEISSRFLRKGGMRNILSAAIYCKDKDIINMILAQDPDLDFEDSQYGTPLVVSMPSVSKDSFKSLNGSENFEFMELLLSRGADLWAGTAAVSTLEKITASNLNYIVRRMLKEAWGLPKDINKKDTGFGRTLLHWAVIKKTTDLVKLLLSYGASTTIQDNNGYTPLHFAFGQGQLKIGYALVSHGARLDTPDHNGVTPIVKAQNSYCSGGGRQAVVEFLLKCREMDFETAYKEAGPYELYEQQEEWARQSDIEEGEVFSRGFNYKGFKTEKPLRPKSHLKDISSDFNRSGGI